MERALAVGALVAVVGCGGGGGTDLTGFTAAGQGGAGSGGGDQGAGGGFGAGFSTGNSSGTSTGGGNAHCTNALAGIIRDFRDDHPDFEAELGTDKGIVESELGSDGKPVYAGPTPTTHGQAAFDQWFRDVAGVNLPIPLSIPLTESEPGIFTFDDSAFFPIDGQGFGNQGRAHNYHFTYEIRAEFEYLGGEIFTFTGDDDLFAFINGILAIDLGGVHGPQSDTIDLDARADELGITLGGVYPLDFFFAERHTTQSNFRIDTTIACFDEVVIPH
jgi:fibro-slime domain-containing protein